MRKFLAKRLLNPEWHLKFIKRLSYTSLLLDVCIAILTFISLKNIENSRVFLLPVELMLTIVVVLSCISAFFIFLTRISNYMIQKIARIKLGKRRWNHKLKRYSTFYFP